MLTLGGFYSRTKFSLIIFRPAVREFWLLFVPAQGGGMEIVMKKMCILEDKICTSCGECNMCDLDKTKVCNNCEKCLNMPKSEYYEILIDDIMNTDEK